MYEIEKNVPIPKTHSGRKISVYPFEQMELGDSFFIPLTEGKTIKRIQGCVVAYYSRKYGKGKFMSRSCPDGVRVWKVKEDVPQPR